MIKVISFLLSLFMTVGQFFGISYGAKEAKIARAEEGCKASFAAISDIHLYDMEGFQNTFELGLQDMENAEDRLDAVIFNGDITNHGYTAQWSRFAEAVTNHDIADNIIPVIGNHDTWGPSRDDYALTTETFCYYTKLVSGKDIDKVYYSTTINGYPAIILGSEADHTYATVSQEQIDWFAEEMEKASGTGLPIFVFFHQPFNGTHGLPYNWELEDDADADDGGIGDASDAILEIVEKYQNVFYVSGHIHAGLCSEDDDNFYSSIEKHDGYTLINLPSFMYFDVKRGGHVANGTGYVFEVYDGKVMIRARNFITGTWLTKYDETIDLV